MSLRPVTNIVVAAVMLSAIQPLAASARQTSIAERSQLAASIAAYIKDGDYRQSRGQANPFQSSVVEIGAAVIVWPFALANWRTPGGSVHGQVSFFYFCDHWNVGVVERRRIRSTELISSMAPKPLTASAATALTAELAAAEASPSAYLKATANAGC
jgi:hypothetical protein